MAQLVGTDAEGVWKVVDAIFFQDITAATKIEGIGLFYIIGQLFMRGLQMMIVPLVLCSLSLALCSLADPKKLGCSKDITSFVLPTGMTVNMNGTTANDSNYIYCCRSRCGDYTCNINAYSFLVNLYRNRYTGYSGSRKMVYIVMMGLGLNSELCMIGYSLILAMNYLPGMAVITLNVIGDAATNVIVCSKEGKLDKEVYNKK